MSARFAPTDAAVVRITGEDAAAFLQGQCTADLRGVPLTVEWELVRCEEPSYAEWAGKGPARSKAITSYRLTPEGDGTLFSYSNEFKTPLGPLGAVAQRAIAGDMPESEAIASLERLRKICE